MQGILHGLKHLALVALILRAMLPAGWMPIAAEATFTICSVNALHQQQPDNKAPGEPSQLEKPCAFFGIPQLAATPDAPALRLPAFHAFVASTDRAYAVRFAGHYQPQSPRAPPLNA